MDKINYSINHTKQRNKLFKYFFLLSGVLIALSLFVFSFSKEEDGGLDPILKPVIISASKEVDLTLGNPVLEGVSKDNLPYKIVAMAVMRHHNNIYDMKKIDGRHGLSDGTLSIKAKSGKFDDGSKLFTLLQEVVINFEDLTLTGERVDLNLHSNLISSEKPVEVAFKNSTVKAGSFNVDHSNKVMNFQDGVVATFNLNDF